MRVKILQTHDVFSKAFKMVIAEVQDFPAFLNNIYKSTGRKNTEKTPEIYFKTTSEFEMLPKVVGR